MMAAQDQTFKPSINTSRNQIQQRAHDENRALKAT
jgi:hypothetical protein